MILFYCDAYKKKKGLSRILVFSACKKYCDIFNLKLNSKPEIYNNQGKLSFLAGDVNFNISISHSDNLWVAMIGESKVGIDIEKYRELDYMALSKRFFSNDEYSLVSNGGIKEFFRIWTAKEAFLKITEGNLINSLKSNLVIPKDYFLKYDDEIFEGFHLTYILKGEDNCLNQIINLHI